MFDTVTTAAEACAPKISSTTPRNLQIARAVDAVGQPAFLPALAALCEGASGYSSSFITAYFPDRNPALIYDNLDQADSDTTTTPYLEFAYLLDPFHSLYREGIGDAVVWLNDCAPDDFKLSEYYQTFYRDTGIYDETGLFVSFDGGASLVISLGNREDGFQRSPQGRASLEELLPIIAALCRRHWPLLEVDSIAGNGRLGLQLEKSFERFGSSFLSAREAEIVRLILKGHSSKSMARILGNSPETVKVHRKRIYAKLNIASQGELFSMFLEALGRTPPNATDDPLTYLDREIVPRDPMPGLVH